MSQAALLPAARAVTRGNETGTMTPMEKPRPDRSRLADLWAMRRLHRLVSLLLDSADERAWFWRIEVKVLSFLLNRYDRGGNPDLLWLPSDGALADGAIPVVSHPRSAIGALSQHRIARLLQVIAWANRDVAGGNREQTGAG